MASQTAVVAQHATLSGTTADLVTFSATGKKSIRVTNHDSAVDLYFNINSATVPTSSADDTYFVMAGGSLVVTPGGDILTCRIVGNGNAYSAEIAYKIEATAGDSGASGVSIVKEVKAATPTQASVASSASNVTLLASNTARLGATLFNDSSSICYVKLGATATNASYSVQLSALSYFEVPFGYTGIIDGIWVTATGNMRVTELAA